MCVSTRNRVLANSLVQVSVSMRMPIKPRGRNLSHRLKRFQVLNQVVLLVLTQAQPENLVVVVDNIK